MKPKMKQKRRHTGGRPKPELADKTMNGWQVLEDAGYNGRTYLFKCKCLRCGNVSIRSAGQIRHKKSDRCANCPPMYHFRFEDGAAHGTLPDGSQFIIDEADVPEFSLYYWRKGKDGYVVTHIKHPGQATQVICLHRWLLGVDNPKVKVDHINRNRMDCRRANLRTVDDYQNARNHGLFNTNKTGYTGVYYSKCAKRYEVKIGIGDKRARLGSSKNDIVKLAQMYNIAALFFYGKYAVLNDVPAPSDELVRQVTERCEYLERRAS